MIISIYTPVSNRIVESFEVSANISIAGYENRHRIES